MTISLDKTTQTCCCLLIVSTPSLVDLCAHIKSAVEKVFLLRLTPPAGPPKAKTACVCVLKQIKQIAKTSSRNHKPARQPCSFITSELWASWIWYSLSEERCKCDNALKVDSWPLSAAAKARTHEQGREENSRPGALRRREWREKEEDSRPVNYRKLSFCFRFTLLKESLWSILFTLKLRLSCDLNHVVFSMIISWC